MPGAGKRGAGRPRAARRGLNRPSRETSAPTPRARLHQAHREQTFERAREDGALGAARVSQEIVRRHRAQFRLDVLKVEARHVSEPMQPRHRHDEAQL